MTKTAKKSTNTGQTVKRDKRSRFVKGSKPKNGFDKNPQNIAPGGLWRYKEYGKSAILDIFKLTVEEFNSLKTIKDSDKTVLDEMLYMEFKSAMAGNSKDMDFLFTQAFGQAPTYQEAQEAHYKAFEKQEKSALEQLTVEELRALIKDAQGDP